MVVSVGVPGGGSDEQSTEIGDLDARARSACAIYTPVAGDVRSGELTGPPLFRVIQDIFNEARLSETENFAAAVRDLLNASIAGDVAARDERLDRLDAACASAG